LISRLIAVFLRPNSQTIASLYAGLFYASYIMIHYDQLKKQLVRHEGERFKPYKCTSGFITIGVGRNLQTRGITHDESMYMLENDISYFEEALRERLESFRSFCPTRQAVLVNMAFNLGVKGLLNFKRMLNALEQEDYSEAAKELLDSNYAKQVGNRANELAEQIKSGEWQ
jgi:lysozyme